MVSLYRLHKSTLKRILPMVVFLLCMVITAIMIKNQINNQQRLVHQHTNTAAEQVCIRLEEFMESRLSALAVFAERWVQRPDFSRKRFLQFAELYYLSYPGFQAINWVDTNGVIRWVYPEELNRRAIGMDIHEHPDPVCREIFARVEKTQEYGITPCMELFQGGEGFATDWPLIYKGKIQGYLNAVFQVKPLIDICLAKGVFDDFWLSVYEGDRLIYQYRPVDGKNRSEVWYVQKEIQFRGKNWLLMIEPKPKLYAATTVIANLPLLFFGLLVSIGMGLLVYSLIRRANTCRLALEEREFVEESLVKSEERFRQVVDSTGDWVWEMNASGLYIYSSHNIENILGYTSAEVIGRHFYDFFLPEDYEKQKKQVFEIFGRKEPFRHFVSRNVHKDGHTVILDTTGVPLTGIRGELIGYRGCDRDITARVRAEEESKKSFERLKKITEGIVHAMALAVEMKDPYTAGHQRRVAQLACVIAKEMGLTEKKIEGIRIAAILHDVGKILTPHEILNKPGMLSDAEMDEIKEHPRIGAEILKTIEFGLPIADVVLQHHERINGSGYPQKLSGKNIMIEAKIVAVADVVEAMCFERPYRPAFSTERALKEISQNKGILYDSDVVDTCIKIFSEKGFTFD